MFSNILEHHLSLIFIKGAVKTAGGLSVLALVGLSYQCFVYFNSKFNNNDNDNDIKSIITFDDDDDDDVKSNITFNNNDNNDNDVKSTFHDYHCDEYDYKELLNRLSAKIN